MAGVFGYGDLMRAAPGLTMVTGTIDAGMPASNLYDPQPGMRTRFVSGTVVRFVVDFGAAVTAGLIVLGNTTLDNSGVVRAYASLTDPTGVAAEVFTTSTTTPDADRSRGQAVILRPADVSFRYLRIHIENPPGGFVDVGFLAVFPTVRLVSSMGFGFTEGRVAVGVREVNGFTGAEFGVPGLAQPRLARFALPTLRAAEYHGTLRAMLDDTGPADDVAWVPDSALSAAEMNRRTIYGGLARPGQDMVIARDRPMLASAVFSLVERV